MQYACGSFGRIVAIRLAPGEDLLEGLTAGCQAAGIKQGVIVSGVGSLDGAHYFDPVVLHGTKAGYGYGDALSIGSPIELTGLSGMICVDDAGQMAIHAHCSLGDTTGRAFGGHVIPGNHALLTIDIVVAEITGMHMGRRYDPDLDVMIFRPEPLESKQIEEK
jgi:predicted DNA-binding protein with PD1-like motif